MLEKVNQSDGTDDAKKAAIAAALARAQAKKTTQAPPQNIDNLTAAQRKQIDEIDQRRAQQSAAPAQPSKESDS